MSQSLIAIACPVLAGPLFVPVCTVCGERHAYHARPGEVVLSDCEDLAERKPYRLELATPDEALFLVDLDLTMPDPWWITSRAGRVISRWRLRTAAEAMLRAVQQRDSFASLSNGRLEILTELLEARKVGSK